VSGNFSRPRGTSLKPYQTGDVVLLIYVKPPGARCTIPWKKGAVIALVSNTTVKVDSTNRHVSDLSLCHAGSLSDTNIDGGVIIEDHESAVEDSENESDVNSDEDDMQDMADAPSMAGDRVADGWVAADNENTGYLNRDRKSPAWHKDYVRFSSLLVI